MSITHRRLVRTEGQCPPNLGISGPTSETTGTGSGVGGVGFVQGLRSRKRQLSFERKGPSGCIGFQTRLKHPDSKFLCY